MSDLSEYKKKLMAQAKRKRAQVLKQWREQVGNVDPATPLSSAQTQKLKELDQRLLNSVKKKCDAFVSAELELSATKERASVSPQSPRTIKRASKVDHPSPKTLSKKTKGSRSSVQKGRKIKEAGVSEAPKESKKIVPILTGLVGLLILGAGSAGYLISKDTGSAFVPPFDEKIVEKNDENKRESINEKTDIKEAKDIVHKADLTQWVRGRAESQIPIAWVEQMAPIPEPLIVRDWAQVSKDYYKYILRPNHSVDGHLLMSATVKGQKSARYPVSSEHVKSSDGKAGWKAEFFDGTNFEKRVKVRHDPEVVWNWEHGPPIDELKRDRFSVRWETQLTSPVTKDIEFFLEADDGAMVSFNGKPIFEKIKGAKKRKTKVKLVKGEIYDIVIEFVENSGVAKISFHWDYISPEVLAAQLKKGPVEFRMPTYRESKPGGEIFTNLTPIIGAKMMGMDPNEMVGFNIVESAKDWYDSKHGIYRHGPGNHGADLHSGIYGYWSSVYGIMMANLFPEDRDFQNHSKTATRSFLRIAKGLGAPGNPNFDTLGYNFENDGPGGRNEPMNRLGNAPIVAWMLLLGYDIHKDPEMLECAQATLKWYSENSGRYEATHMMAPYLGARLNAEHGGDFDLTKLYDVWFGDGVDKGWRITTGQKLNGITVDGLDGAQWKRKDAPPNFYAFTMGSLTGPGFLLPALRYDQRYAKSVGRYVLNAAVSCRLLQGYQLDWENQDHKDWKDQYDPDGLLFYEGISTHEPSKEKKFKPYAMGDPIKAGWGVKKVNKEDYLREKKEWFSKRSANIGFYMGNHVGLLGGIFEKTNVPAILRWDCLKSEWNHPDAHPTYLYFNPYEQSKVVKVPLQQKTDIYDSVSGVFLAQGVDRSYDLEIPKDTAAILVMVPHGLEVSESKGKLLAGGIVIDHRSNLN